MSLLSLQQKVSIKTAREKLYDTQIEARTISSSVIPGDAYGRVSAPTYVSTLFYAQVAWGNRYGYSNQEGGIVISADVLVITSLDNNSIITLPKTYLVIEDNKYSMDKIEKYSDFNEIVIHCNKMA